MELTESQRIAIEKLDGSVSVSAGAGSGKTEVLVRRFCEIVERGLAGVDEILTVTFTEKGAMEMRSRIARRLARAGRRDLCNKISAAYIGTIHSFCRRALAENPFEAGVDPEFVLLTDTEQQALQARLLDEMLQSGSNEIILPLVTEHGVGWLKSSVTAIYSRVRSLGLEPTNALIPEAADLQVLAEDLELRLTELFAAVQSPTEALARTMAAIEATAPDALAGARAIANEGFDWAALANVKACAACFAMNVPKAVKPAMGAAKSAASAFIGAALDLASRESASQLLALVADFGARYAAEKRRMGKLDYDDLLLGARRLFVGPDGLPTSSAEEYRRRFKFVTLDEFQDTNPLQKQIVDAVSRPDRVFTVGDAKQSIFSFIYSDVEVFRRHHEAVRSGDGMAVSFRENFRSCPGVIGFVNWLFATIWGTGSGLEFEPLLCEGAFSTTDTPAVEVIITGKEAPEGSDARGMAAARKNEAVAIARRILELTAPNSTARRTKDGRAGEPIRLRDIIILMRSTSSLATYEAALAEHGIDTYVVSGRGFYSTPEIQDILSLLKAIDNPLDDIAMCAVLRSPFAGVTDDALLLLTRDWSQPSNGIPPVSPRQGKVWEGIHSEAAVAALSPEDAARVVEFRETIADLLARRSRPDVGRLLQEILRRTHFGARLLAMPGGRRKYANVRKLLEIAIEFESGGTFGLPDFIAYLQNMESLAERETSAPTESEAGDAVRIMTVHKAKGLQAPVVFLADTSRRPPGGSDLPVFDPEIGLAAKIRNPLDYSVETPGRYAEIADRLKSRSIAEEKRLLYVALTRAEERLLIVGSGDLKLKEKPIFEEMASWRAWIGRALGIEEDTEEGILEAGDAPVLFRREITEPDASARRIKRAVADEHEGAILAGAPIPIDDGAGIADAVRVIEGILSPKENRARGVARLTVSQILDYLECPFRYRATHILGAEERVDERVYGDRTAGGSSSAELGALTHAILDRIDFRRAAGLQIERAIAATPEGSPREDARRIVTRFAEGGWYRSLGQARHLLRETPFEITLGGAIVTGRVDAMAMLDGGWTVLDYKTGVAETCERYRMQVGIYALAAAKLLDSEPTCAGVIFVPEGEDLMRGDALAEQERSAEQAIATVIEGIAADDFSEKPGIGCGYCPARGRCPSACRTAEVPGETESAL